MEFLEAEMAQFAELKQRGEEDESGSGSNTGTDTGTDTGKGGEEFTEDDTFTSPEETPLSDIISSMF